MEVFKARPVTIYKWTQMLEKKDIHPRSYMKKIPDDKGSFIQFGVDYEEFETGPGNYSTAIVELSDGTVITPPANLIRFDDREGK